MNPKRLLTPYSRVADVPDAVLHLRNTATRFSCGQQDVYLASFGISQVVVDACHDNSP